MIGILAALHNKHVTGLGQHVDISMLDVAVALLANQGMNYLAKKQRQKRVGNNHPNVVPYQVMPAKDGCSYFLFRICVPFWVSAFRCPLSGLVVLVCRAVC